MNNLNNLLERFYASLNGDERRKEFIRETIEKHTKGKVSKEQVFYKDGTLEIEGSAVLKNEIKIREVEFLRELESNSIRVTRIIYK